MNNNLYICIAVVVDNQNKVTVFYDKFVGGKEDVTGRFLLNTKEQLSPTQKILMFDAIKISKIDMLEIIEEISWEDAHINFIRKFIDEIDSSNKEKI